MAGFDPDAYLANKQAQSFDPDAYLNARAVPPPKATPSMSFGDYAIDMARSIPGGLAKGAASTLGMLGDFLNPSGTETIEGAGGEQITVNKGANRQGFPTSQQLNSAFSAPTGGYYKPKTTGGEYTEAVASFAPAALGGPGSLARRGLTTAGSAIGSEMLGRATKGTALETPARIAGVLLGHKVASQGHRLATTGSMSNLRDAEKITPKFSELKKTGNDLYEEVKASPAVIKNADFSVFNNTVKNVTNKIRLSEERHPEAIKLANRIQNIAKDKNIDFVKLFDLRTDANALTGLKKSDASAIKEIVKTLDGFVEKLKNPSVYGDETANAAKTFSKANEFYRKGSQGEVIEKTIARAKNKSGPALNNFDSQARKEFKKLRDNERVFNRLDPEVQTAVKAVAEGSGLGQNLAYGLGSLVPATSMTGGIATGAGLVAGAVNPSLLAALIPAVPAKLFSAAKTGRAARTASVLARGGKIEPAAPLLTKEKAIAAALAARPNYEEFMQ